MLRWYRSLLLAALLGSASTAAAVDEGPLERSHALLAILKTVHTAPEGGVLSPDERRANLVAFKNLDSFFDYGKLSSDAIAPHKKALSPQQLAQFTKDFRDLIRLVSFPRSGAFVNQAEVTVSAPKLVGRKTVVDIHATVPQEDTETDISFQWETDGKSPRITDVQFDGVSVVKDYQNQFGRLIKRDGAEGLLKKLSVRLEEERKANEP